MISFLVSCISYLGVGIIAIPTGIISAGFVEQNYAGKRIQEIEEAHQITIFLVLRDDLSVLPQPNMILNLNDVIVIREQKSD